MGVRSPQAIFTVDHAEILRDPRHADRARDATSPRPTTTRAAGCDRQRRAWRVRRFPGEDADRPTGSCPASTALGFMEIVGVVADVRSVGSGAAAAAADLHAVRAASARFDGAHAGAAHGGRSAAALAAGRPEGPRAERRRAGPRSRRWRRRSIGRCRRRGSERCCSASSPRSRSLLAMAGVYGVVSFTVSQRTSELGLRMALGAQPIEIVKLTVLSGLRLTVVGVAARMGRVAGARARRRRRCCSRPARAIRSSSSPCRRRSSLAAASRAWRRRSAPRASIPSSRLRSE